MKEEAAGIRLSAPYRRNLDSQLARRLCSDAWSDRADAEIPEGIDDALRASCLRALLAVASDDETDVLERFRSTARASGVTYVVDSGQGRTTALRSLDLRCSVLLPASLVKDGRVVIRAVDDPATDRDAVRAEIPAGTDQRYLARIAARARCEEEQDRITRVNRSTGRITWRQLLDRIPETREHVMALRADSRKAEPVDARMAA